MLRRVLSPQGTLSWGNLTASVPAGLGALTASKGATESRSGLPGDTPALGAQGCVHRNPQEKPKDSLP